MSKKFELFKPSHFNTVIRESDTVEVANAANYWLNEKGTKIIQYVGNHKQWHATPDCMYEEHQQMEALMIMARPVEKPKPECDHDYSWFKLETEIKDNIGSHNLTRTCPKCGKDLR